MENEAKTTGSKDLQEVASKNSGSECGEHYTLRLPSKDMESQRNKETSEHGRQGIPLHMERQETAAVDPNATGERQYGGCEKVSGCQVD